MALVYGNQFAGGGYISLFGKTSVHNTAYGKLGEDQIYTSGNINGKNLGINNNECSKDLENLYNSIGFILDDVMNKINLGKYEEIDINEINNLTTKLENQYTVVNDNNFNNYKETFNNVINLVLVSNNQHNNYEQLNNSYNVAKEKVDILEDPVKLQEYINELKKKNSFYLFNLPDISTVSANVKPEYSEYFKLYGVPKDLEFDQEKLDAIIKKIYG